MYISKVMLVPSAPMTHQTVSPDTKLLTMTPDMSPATRVDAVTVAVPLAADTRPMATWSWFLGFEKGRKQKQELKVKTSVCSPQPLQVIRNTKATEAELGRREQGQLLGLRSCKLSEMIRSE